MRQNLTENAGSRRFDQQKTGRFIARLRGELGLTQAELGERLGVTNKTVSRWERGNYMPDLALIPELAAALGVSASELLAAQRFAEQSYKQEADAALLDMTGRWQRLQALRRRQSGVLEGLLFCVILLAYCSFVGNIPPDRALRGICLGAGLFAAGVGCLLLYHSSPKLAVAKNLAGLLLYFGGFLCLSRLIGSVSEGEAYIRLVFLVFIVIALAVLTGLYNAYDRDMQRLLEPERQ